MIYCQMLAISNRGFVKARELEQQASNSPPCRFGQAFEELKALSLSLVAAIQMITPKAILLTTSAKL